METSELVNYPTDVTKNHQDTCKCFCILRAGTIIYTEVSSIWIRAGLSISQCNESKCGNINSESFN
jgi:hypothetical protein